MKLLACALAAIGAISLASSANGQSQGATSRGQSLAATATVVVDTTNPGLTIPSNFMGFSIEAYDIVTNGYYQGTTGHAASMISLIQLLGGNGVIRVGGNSSDEATPPALTQLIANNFQSFVAGIGAGWTNPLIYGLDLVAADSTTAATQAGYIATAFGSSHVIFQFGNEPISQGSFTTSTYITAWNAYYTAVTGAVAGASYAAWDDTGIQLATSIVPNLTPGLSGLTALTYHLYTGGSAGGGGVTTLTPAGLLGSLRKYMDDTGGNGSGGFLNVNSNYAPMSKQRMSETNTMGNSGGIGISNVMVSATWLIDYAIALANDGYTGVNIHNHYVLDNVAHPGYYNPIVQLGNGNFGPGPIFYGMYLFSKIQGQQVLPSSVSGGVNVTAIATQRTANKSNILVTNNNVNGSVSLTPKQSAAWSTATVLQMTSPSGLGCSETAPTVGGQAIGESGVWSGSTFSISSGQSFTLGPCEAALVSVQ